MTKIVLVRHGETFWNLEARIQGHLDSPLTETGIAQAEALAQHFKSQNFAALYSSDLGRAYETARRISEPNGLSVSVKTCLRERNLGILQGQLKGELENQFPQEAPYYRNNDPDYLIPEGETLRQLSQRSVKCLETIAKKHNGERVLVVTHNGVLVSILKYTLCIPLETPRYFVSLNTGISVFSYQNGIWKLEVWGDSSHIST
jgi:probable phosphoglycerate mutase